jgi:hypothetical protein
MNLNGDLLLQAKEKIMNESITECKEISSTFHDELVNLNKIGIHKKTIEVWDWLVENNYSPADFSNGIVTMRRQGFMKLAKEVNNVISVMENRLWRVSAVWIDGIEISFTEMKEPGKWHPIDNWEPIE